MDREPLRPFVDYPARTSQQGIIRYAEDRLNVKVRFGNNGIYLVKPASDYAMKVIELSKSGWK